MRFMKVFLFFLESFELMEGQTDGLTIFGEEEKLVLRYSEIEHYTFGVDQGAPGTGHFTQVIGFMMLSTFLRTAMFYHNDDHFDFR